MDIDDLQKAWQGQKYSERRPEEAIGIILGASAKLDRGIYWVDVRESVAVIAAAVTVIWGAHWLDLPLWPIYGAAICALWIPAYLIVSRRSVRASVPGITPRESVQNALYRLDYHIRIYRTIAWWYLLPCVGAVVLILTSVAIKLDLSHWRQWYPPFLVVIGTVVVLYPIIYWLNLRVVREALLPLRQELERTLADLDSLTG